MGEHDVDTGLDPAEARRFTKALLTELRALEEMLGSDLFETDRTRIGAEQEVFLVDRNWRPAMNGTRLLEVIDDPHFTTELGQFNLECNLDPLELGGDCLHRMESQLRELLDKASQAGKSLDTKVVLTGILPTLDKSDLSLDNMTPIPRYYRLNEAMNRLRGERYHLHLRGREELDLVHDNVLLEACNTSFQVHLQVAPSDFVRTYNIAQTVAAPLLAASTNSPLLFGRELWRETRIGLFQQSVDTRTPTGHLRQAPPRVSFGRRWLDGSPLDLFREDIARFQVILTRPVDEDPFEVLKEGGIPTLDALRLHNGTVYRWNRICYGISEGRPHLRIENRVLPAGPTPVDEVANGAFWLGLVLGMRRTHADIREVMSFEAVAENFTIAARLGLRADFRWIGGRQVSARELILSELLPIAEEGLASVSVDSDDIERYLGIIRERVDSARTGSAWLLDSLDRMKGTSRSARLAALVAATESRQQTGKPVHTWTPAEPGETGAESRLYSRVAQLMSTDLFTVSPDELVDMVACVMRWQHVRHVPVEDSKHRLVGLVTQRCLLRLMSDNLGRATTEPVPVSEIMQTKVVTVHPETPSLEAIDLMRSHKIGCLPVVDRDDHLVGIVTEHDFMDIAGRLLEEHFRE